MIIIITIIIIIVILVRIAIIVIIGFIDIVASRCMLLGAAHDGPFW